MLALTRAELQRVTGETRMGYDSDTSLNGGGGGGGGGGGQPPADPPNDGDDATEDDYAHSAFFDDEMDALEDGATEFAYYIAVEEAPTSGGSGGGDSGGGYDSADYNGPESVYIDYFATQHGPESIEIRASVSAQAFAANAQRLDQIRAALTDIVQQASDPASASQQMSDHLASVGLGDQHDTQISDTGLAAAQQSIRQSGQNDGSDIIVVGTRYRVGIPNTIASFGTQGQFMLASYMPAPAQSTHTKSHSL